LRAGDLPFGRIAAKEADIGPFRLEEIGDRRCTFRQLERQMVEAGEAARERRRRLAEFGCQPLAWGRQSPARGVLVCSIPHGFK
jgi:hypothetical protein